MNILEEVQIFVADKLNADQQLSACPFLVENKKDIDYEIKNALGRQGICGLVMTPKATYAGAYMDVGIAWQIDELEIDVVENVTVNRGKKDGYVTGQDAAMRLFEVLCPLSGYGEGLFSPVSYLEGEDGNLLVNKSVLKCLVHKTLIPAKTIVLFADGTSSTYDIKGPIEIDWLGVGVYPGDVVDVLIGEEVTGLGVRSFTGFGSLSSIVVPKNVTSISGEAFSWTGLRDVVIENGVTELGYGVFSYSNGLSSITLPSTLQKIGADVFEECGGLSSIVLLKSVVDISPVAFRYSRLSAVTMDGRTKAETKAIDNYPWGLGAGSIIHCTDGDIVVGLTKVTYTDGRNVELDIQGELGEASIPDREYISELDIGNAVTSIGEHAFDRCAYLETVVIPKSVETIGTQGFSRTRRLTNVTIEGNGLKTLGFGAFAAATALSSISLPDSVVSIRRGAFEDCVSFTSIVIPASVQTMDREVFFGCSELMNVTFSSKTKATVKGMENYSWALPSGCVIHCTDGNIVVGSETKVTYQNGDVVEYDINGELTRGQISGLTSIVSLDIGLGVTSLATNAFYSCINLSSVTIPDSVSSIGDSAFKNCYNLTSISLPDTVQSIAEDAFAEDPNIEVTFQGRTKAEVQAMENYPWGIENTQNIHNIIGPNTRVKYSWSQSWDSLPLSGTLNSDDLPSRDGINYIGIGSSIDEIGYRAFRGMEFLTGVEIPDTVTTIGTESFAGAEGMPEIEIPSSVSSIGSDAFFGCHMLSSVMFEGKTLEQVQAMANYPWGIRDASFIHAEL